MADEPSGQAPAATQTPVVQTADGIPADEQRVPYKDLARVVKQRDAIEAEKAALTERLAQAEARAESAKILQAELEKQKQITASVERRFTHYQATSAVGIVQPEIVNAIEQHWTSLPADNRPKLADMLAEWKGTDEAPGLEKAPLLLRPHLEAAWKPKPVGQVTAQAQQRQVGGHASASQHQPNAGRALDAQAINDLAQKVQRGEITRADFVKQTTGR